MQLPHDAMLLRIFFGERDRYGGRPQHDAIVHKARELKLAGATVLRGLMGYGRKVIRSGRPRNIGGKKPTDAVDIRPRP